MRLWTYSEIKTKVLNDTGTEQEEFVSESELRGYCNEAIDEAESEIHTLYEDYFLTYSTINMVSGTKEYSLPTDIYANKIRAVLHENGDLLYPMERIRFSDKFQDIRSTEKFDTAGRYRYFLVNTSATNGVKMYIVPTPRDNLTGGVRIWYIRNANRITATTDYCDIPEFTNFIIQYMKTRVYEKEGNPLYTAAIRILDQQRAQMVSTLSNMVIDGDTRIEQDLDIYTNMV